MITDLNPDFIVTGILLFFTSILFWVNALCDPGIVARMPNQPKVSSLGNNYVYLPTFLEIKTIEFRNKSYALKYCLHCKFHRPLRSHHCKVCDVCIEELGK